MKRLVFSMLVGAGIALAAPAYADHGRRGHDDHAQVSQPASDMLASSNPANGAVLAQAPRALSLTFEHPVMLQTVAITGPNDAPVHATFRRPASPATAYSVALPELAAGQYNARWTASGHGHPMAGELSFTVQ